MYLRGTLRLLAKGPRSSALPFFNTLLACPLPSDIVQVYGDSCATNGVALFPVPDAQDIDGTAPF